MLSKSVEPPGDERSPAPRRWDRADAVVLLLLVAALVGTSYLALCGPSVPGFREDDGVYLVTAQALAEGRGYRHLHLPGEPYQTKYPILYPLVLSGVWRLLPDYPDNLWAMRVLNALFAGGAAWLAYRLARRVWRLPAVLAGSGILLATVNPIWTEKIQETMSEHLYALLSMAALLFATQAAEPGRAGPAARRRVILALLAGLAAGAAGLARSIGVTLVAAILPSLLLRRSWRAALVMLLAAAIPLGSWTLWRNGAAAENAQIPETAAYAYDLDYSAWIPKNLADLGWVAWLNSAAMACSLFADVGYIPSRWASEAVNSGEAPLLYACMVSLVGLCSFGLFVTLRRSQPTLHFYLAAYLGLVLIWPFTPPTRFFIPLLPLLCTALLVGLCGVASLFLRAVSEPSGASARKRRRGRDRSSPPATLPRWWDQRANVVAVLVAVLIGGAWVRASLDRSLGARSRRIANIAAQREDAAEMVRTRTPETAVLTGQQGSFFYLATGRKFVPLLPLDDPFRTYYTRDRSFGKCGREMTNDEIRFYLALTESRQMQCYRVAGVTHAVSFAEMFQRAGPTFWLRSRFPGAFELVDEVGAAHKYRLYEIDTQQP